MIVSASKIHVLLDVTSLFSLNERLHEGGKIMKFESETVPSESFEAVVDPFDKLAVEDKLSQVCIHSLKVKYVFTLAPVVYPSHRFRPLISLIRSLIYKAFRMCISIIAARALHASASDYV